MYDDVRFNAVPTSYRTHTADLCIKSPLDITILERRFVLVLHQMHINHNTGCSRAIIEVHLLHTTHTTLCYDLNAIYVRRAQTYAQKMHTYATFERFHVRP